MKRVAHIKDGQIVNVSICKDDHVLTAGQMLESEAVKMYPRAILNESDAQPNAAQVMRWLLQRQGLNAQQIKTALKEASQL